jgi:hypothetical protein
MRRLAERTPQRHRRRMNRWFEGVRAFAAMEDLSGRTFFMTKNNDCQVADSRLNGLVDLERGRRDPVYFTPSPTTCDLCGKPLAESKYMIDGNVIDSHGWACMCPSCFSTRGQGIGWGRGQLYIRDPEGWLQVAGFPPDGE